MNTIEAVYKRRSVKQFDKTHVLTADEERRYREAKARKEARLTEKQREVECQLDNSKC